VRKAGSLYGRTDVNSIDEEYADRVNRVFDRAIQVLEDREAAQAWMHQENRSLGGKLPLSLLDTKAGYQLVLDTLGRIESGTVS
jgi:putative toxin-antitoxin system antitoxin component (TIGR02293 family)